MRLIHSGGTRPDGWGASALGNNCISDKKHCQKHNSQITAATVSEISKKIKIIYKYLYNLKIDRFTQKLKRKKTEVFNPGSVDYINSI